MEADLADIMKGIESAHRRVDELRIQVVRLEGQMEGQSAAIKKLEDVPTKLSHIEATLNSMQHRLPQQAPPVSPWTILMTVLGWVLTLILAVVAWLRA